MSDHHPSDRRPGHLRAVPTDEQPGTTQPPHDNDAEKAVLGAMLTNRAACDDVTLTLTPNDFYQPRHELIYNAIVHHYSRGYPVDPLTIGDHLATTNQLQRAGERSYLAELTLTPEAAIPASAGYYADIIHRHARARDLDTLGTTLRALATAHDFNPDHAYATITDRITALTQTPGGTEHTNTWAPVDLTEILTGELTTPKATALSRRDGKFLLYPYAVHSISGEPGSGKTWAALVGMAQALDNGEHALMFDFEDRPQTIVARLRALGIDDQAMLDRLHYIRPETALNPANRTQLQTLAARCTIAVIDGITEAMTMHGLSLMDNEDAARWLALLPNLIANSGPATVQIDHVVKNADNRGRYALGAQHKLAGITGVAYKMLTIKSFGHGTKGHAKLVVDKDKHGDVGPNGITAADLHMDATAGDGTLYAWLDTPQASTGEDGHFRPTTLMQRVSTFLLVNPGRSLNEIKAGVRGKDSSIAEAVQALVIEGNIRTESAARGGSVHYLETPFEDES